MGKIICYDQQELVKAITQWHRKQVKQLNQVLESKDSSVNYGAGSDDEAVANSDKATGFRAGVLMALYFLGQLPEMETEKLKKGRDDE